MPRVLLIAILMAAPFTAGCGAPRENIPTYPMMDAPRSLDVIRERSSKLYVLSGEGAITLIDERGQSVRLDAALVFAPPDRARVRAWKFGSAVLDLTVTPDELWLFVPPRQGDRTAQLKSASAETGRAIREWLLLLSRGADAGKSSTHTTPSDIVLIERKSDGTKLICTIDRATLTPRHYDLIDESKGVRRFALTLSQYRTVREIVWPMRIEAISETGRVVIEMRDVSLDDDAPTGAFKPPARAVKL